MEIGTGGDTAVCMASESIHQPPLKKLQKLDVEEVWPGFLPGRKAKRI